MKEVIPYSPGCGLLLWLPMLGADLGVAADGTRSSRRLTPVAMAIGTAIRDPARLGGMEARFVGSES